jgi:hypothetical protein
MVRFGLAAHGRTDAHARNAHTRRDDARKADLDHGGPRRTTPTNETTHTQQTTQTTQTTQTQADAGRLAHSFLAGSRHGGNRRQSSHPTGDDVLDKWRQRRTTTMTAADRPTYPVFVFVIPIPSARTPAVAQVPFEFFARGTTRRHLSAEGISVKKKKKKIALME